nr:MAG TPA: protein of unknown function (DUF4376) [Caudoviricetes sp.]
MRKMNFVKTFVPKGQYKEKEEREGVCIVHLDGVLNEEMDAYECVECSMPVSEYSQTAVNEAYAAWKTATANRRLARAKREVLKQIEAYDTSSAVNGFVLNGQSVWLEKATRVGLMNSTTIAKAMGQDTTTLWLGDNRLVVDCDKAIQLLSALEMYALECFNVTAAHKKAVGELTDIGEVLSYDYTKGYPAKLTMTV